MTPFHCRICGETAGHRAFVAREMMFGTREEFRYVECGSCGCVQIAEIPPDLSRYYPADYYSYQPPGRLKALIKGAWLGEPLTASSAVARVLSAVPFFGVAPEWVKRARVGRDADVLDIGCGAGERLLSLRSLGYRRLTGADPYLPEGTELGNGIRVLRKGLADIDGRFDLVMMHHSFEHMPDQAETLRGIARLLKPGGTVLLRVPVASSFAYRHYGADWVQLDPPRHLYLHTEKSIERLAAASGFRVTDRFHDSNAFQFWGSEQYRRDIPIRLTGLDATRHRGAEFSRAEIRAFGRRAAELNASGDGDQAAFYLKTV